MKLRFHMLQAGTCTGPQSVAMKGAPRRKVTFPALCTLIEHPGKGPILYDTGYAPYLHELAKTDFATRLYTKLVPSRCSPDESAVAQIAKLGFRRDEIRIVIISHFHPDHIAGLRDFPEAEFWCFREAFEPLQNLSPFKQAAKAFLPGLLPDDFLDRCKFFSPGGPNPEMYSGFRKGTDLLGDGSLWAIPLPGHAFGQMGLAFEDSNGEPVFLCADASWYSQSIRENRPPSTALRFVLSSFPDFNDSFGNLCRFHKDHPEVNIIPAHCPEVVARYL